MVFNYPNAIPSFLDVKDATLLCVGSSFGMIETSFINDSYRVAIFIYYPVYFSFIICVPMLSLFYVKEGVSL
jgi:hypothetical protein